MLRGKLRVREYHRVRRDASGKLLARESGDRMLGAEDWFQASEWINNAHWFTAIDGPAVILNINARGFEQQTFDNDKTHFGRLYFDISRTHANGLLELDEITEQQALQRFATRDLSAADAKLTVSSRPVKR